MSQNLNNNNQAYLPKMQCTRGGGGLDAILKASPLTPATVSLLAIASATTAVRAQNVAAVDRELRTGFSFNVLTTPRHLVFWGLSKVQKVKLH